MKNNKFSIIIPVYNTEAYLRKCLDSVINNSYKNYEIIVVNDGSLGNTDEIVKEYDNVIYIKEKNKGLSYARNNGLKNATGDYVYFLDSDDYLDKDILKTVNKFVDNEDIIRISLSIDDDKLTPFSIKEFQKLLGYEAFKNICKFKYVEMASLYFFKRDYIKKYQFKENRYHEDFGVIPEIIFKAGSVSAINTVGYYYYKRPGSIMNDKKYDNNYKKCEDVFKQGMEEIKNVSVMNVKKEYIDYFNSFIANSIFIKLNSLTKSDQEKILKEVRKEKLINYLLNKTLKQKLKKFIYKIKYKL